MFSIQIFIIFLFKLKGENLLILRVNFNASVLFIFVGASPNQVHTQCEIRLLV